MSASHNSALISAATAAAAAAVCDTSGCLLASLLSLLDQIEKRCIAH